MNYYQVEAFLSIASTQSLSRAAELLYLAQSTVSHRLSTLEKELGVTLVFRNKGNRMIELTPAGERFLPIARRWEILWEETRQIEEVDPVIPLNIGGVDSVSTHFLYPLYKLLRDREPSINLFVHLCNNSTQAYMMMENHEIDIGLTTVPIYNRNIVLTPILSEPFKFLYFAPGREPVDEVDPAELDPAWEVFQPWGPEYQQWHDYWWPAPQHPFVTFDATGIMGLFLSDERLWTIVPECIARTYAKQPGFQTCRLKSPPPRHVGYMATHRYPRQSSALGISLFEKHLRKFLSTQDLAYREMR